MPYITEELWQRLPGAKEELLHPAYRGAQPTVMLAAYPQAQSVLIDERAEWEMQMVIDLISRVRNIRSELRLKPSEELHVIVGTEDVRLQELFGTESVNQIKRLVRASQVSIRPNLEGVPRASARAVLGAGVEVAVPLEGLIDFAQERERLSREREKLQKEAMKLEAQLSNPQFAERAPAEKVNETRERLADIAGRLKALAEMLEALK
jgi:valyl-tRNA synthetase